MNGEQVAVITGAGSGIGRAAAVGLARIGYRIALVGRTESTLHETAARIAGAGMSHDRSLVIRADIGERDQAVAAIEQVLNHWRRVDVLINNAALCPAGPLASINEKTFRETFAVNVFGPMNLLARLWPVFMHQESGCIVNISSMSTIDPFPGLAVYAASKCALESLARSIRAEDPHGWVRAFNIAPGAVETAMLRSIAPESQLPRNRTLAPEQVARVIVECVTGRRDDMTGKTIQLPSP